MPDIKGYSTGDLGNIYDSHLNTDHPNTKGLDKNNRPGIEAYINEDIVRSYDDNRPILNLLSNDELLNELVDEEAKAKSINALFKNSKYDWDITISNSSYYTDPLDFDSEIYVTPLKIQKGAGLTKSTGYISNSTRKLVGFKRNNDTKFWVDEHQWMENTAPIYSDPDADYQGYYRPIYTDMATSQLPENFETYQFTLLQPKTGKTYTFDIYTDKETVIPLTPSIYNINSYRLDFFNKSKYPYYDKYPDSYQKITAGSYSNLTITEDANIIKPLRREGHKLYATNFNAEAGVYKAELKEDVFRKNKSATLSRIENDINLLRVVNGVKKYEGSSKVYFGEHQDALNILIPLKDNRDFLGNVDYKFQISFSDQFSGEFKTVTITSPETRGFEDFGLSVADDESALGIADGTYDFNLKLNNDSASTNIAISITTTDSLQDIKNSINNNFSANLVYAFARVFYDSIAGSYELRIYSKSSGDYSKVELTPGTNDLAAALGGSYENKTDGKSDWPIYQNPSNTSEHKAIRAGGITTLQDFDSGTFGRDLFEALITAGFDNFEVGINNVPTDYHRNELYIKSNSAAKGYIDLGMSVPLPSTPSGLDPVSTYYFKLRIDHGEWEEFEVTTTTDTTYQGVLDAINGVLAGKAYVKLSPINDVRFESDSYGPNSYIETADGTSGTSLFGAAYPAGGFPPSSLHLNPVVGEGEVIHLKYSEIGGFTIFKDKIAERLVYFEEGSKYLLISRDVEADIRDKIDTEFAYLTNTSNDRWSTHNDRVIKLDLTKHASVPSTAVIDYVSTVVIDNKEHLFVSLNDFAGASTQRYILYINEDYDIYDEDIKIDNFVFLSNSPNIPINREIKIIKTFDTSDSKKYLFIAGGNRIYYSNVASGITSSQTFTEIRTENPSDVSNVNDQIFSNIFDAEYWLANVDPGSSQNEYLIFVGESYDSYGSTTWQFAPILYAIYESNSFTFYAEEIYLKTQLDNITGITKYSGWLDPEQDYQLFITVNVNGPEIWTGNSQNNNINTAGGGDERFDAFSWSEVEYDKIDDEISMLTDITVFDKRIFIGGVRKSSDIFGGIYTFALNKLSKYFKIDVESFIVKNDVLYFSSKNGNFGNTENCILKISKEKDEGRAQLISKNNLTTISNWPSDSAFRIKLEGFNVGGIDYDGEYNITFNGQRNNLDDIINAINGEDAISEITNITVTSGDINNFNGKYFAIYAGTTEYNIWFDITGSDTAPSGATNNPLKCDISSCADVNCISSQISSVINGITGISATSTANIVEAVHDPGNNTDAEARTANYLVINIAQQGEDASHNGFENAEDVNNPGNYVDLTPVIWAKKLISREKQGNVYSEYYKIAIESKISDPSEESGHSDVDETTQSNCKITILEPLSGTSIVGSGSNKIEILANTEAIANLPLVDWNSAELYQLKRKSVDSVSFGGISYIDLNSYIDLYYRIQTSTLRVKDNADNENGFSRGRGTILLPTTPTGLNNDSTIYRLKITIDENRLPTGDKEVTQITTVADSSSSLSGKYFTINAPNGIGGDQEFYVWYNVNNSSTDPAPSGKTGIEVNILVNDSANEVANKTKLAFDNNPWFDATVSTNTVTVTCKDEGAITDAADVNTGFSINIYQQGTNPGKTINHISIIGSNAQTIQDLINVINSQLQNASASLQSLGSTGEYCDIVIKTTTNDDYSSVKIEKDDYFDDIYLLSYQGLDVIPNTTIPGSTSSNRNGAQTFGFTWENADYFLVENHPTTGTTRIYITNNPVGSNYNSRISPSDTVWLDFWEERKLTKVPAKINGSNNIPSQGEWTYDLEAKKIVIHDQPNTNSPEDIIFVDVKSYKYLPKINFGLNEPSDQSTLSNEYYSIEPVSLSKADLLVSNSNAKISSTNYGISLLSTDEIDNLIIDLSFFLPRLDVLKLSRKSDEYGHRIKPLVGITDSELVYVNIPRVDQDESAILYSAIINSEDYNNNKITAIPWIYSNKIDNGRIYIDGSTQYFNAKYELNSLSGLAPIKMYENISKLYIDSYYDLVKNSDPIGIFSPTFRSREYYDIDSYKCIYLDLNNGDDNNDGTGRVKAVKTFNQAINLLTQTRPYLIILENKNQTISTLTDTNISKTFKIYLIAEDKAEIDNLTIQSEVFLQGIRVNNSLILENGHKLTSKYCEFKEIKLNNLITFSEVYIDVKNSIIKEGIKINDDGNNSLIILGDSYISLSHVFISDSSNLLTFKPFSYGSSNNNQFNFDFVTVTTNSTGNILTINNSQNIEVTISNSLLLSDSTTKFDCDAPISISKTISYSITNSGSGTIITNDSYSVNPGDVVIDLVTGSLSSRARGYDEDSIVLNYVDRKIDPGAFIEERIIRDNYESDSKISVLDFNTKRIEYRYSLRGDRFSFYLRFKPLSAYNEKGVIFDSRYSGDYNLSSSQFNFNGKEFFQIVYDNKTYSKDYLDSSQYSFKFIISNSNKTYVAQISPSFNIYDNSDYNNWHELAVLYYLSDTYTSQYDQVDLLDGDSNRKQTLILTIFDRTITRIYEPKLHLYQDSSGNDVSTSKFHEGDILSNYFNIGGGWTSNWTETSLGYTWETWVESTYNMLVEEYLVSSDIVPVNILKDFHGKTIIDLNFNDYNEGRRDDNNSRLILHCNNSHPFSENGIEPFDDYKISFRPYEGFGEHSIAVEKNSNNIYPHGTIKMGHWFDKEDTYNWYSLSDANIIGVKPRSNDSTQVAILNDRPLLNKLFLTIVDTTNNSIIQDVEILDAVSRNETHLNKIGDFYIIIYVKSSDGKGYYKTLQDGTWTLSGEIAIPTDTNTSTYGTMSYIGSYRAFRDDQIVFSFRDNSNSVGKVEVLNLTSGTTAYHTKEFSAGIDVLYNAPSEGINDDGDPVYYIVYRQQTDDKLVFSVIDNQLSGPPSYTGLLIQSGETPVDLEVFKTIDYNVIVKWKNLVSGSDSPIKAAILRQVNLEVSPQTINSFGKDAENTSSVVFTRDSNFLFSSINRTTGEIEFVLTDLKLNVNSYSQYLRNITSANTINILKSAAPVNISDAIVVTTENNGANNYPYYTILNGAIPTGWYKDYKGVFDSYVAETFDTKTFFGNALHVRLNHTTSSGETGIFVADAESNDLSDFDSNTQTNGTIINDNLVSAHKNYSYRFNYDGTGNILHMDKNFSGAVNTYARLYLLISGSFQLQGNNPKQIEIAQFGPYSDFLTLKLEYNDASLGGDNKYKLVAETTSYGNETSSNSIFDYNVWNYVDIEWVDDSANGGWRVWVNGTLLFDHLGQNTASLGHASKIVIGSTSGSYPTDNARLYFDDIRVDSSFIGEYTAGLGQSDVWSQGDISSAGSKHFASFYYTALSGDIEISLSGTALDNDIILRFDKDGNITHVTEDSDSIFYFKTIPLNWNKVYRVEFGFIPDNTGNIEFHIKSLYSDEDQRIDEFLVDNIKLELNDYASSALTYDDGYIAYPTSLENRGSAYFRIKPKFFYDTTRNHTIFSGSNISLSEIPYITHELYYDYLTDSFKFYLTDGDGTTKVELATDEYGDASIQRQLTDLNEYQTIIVNWDIPQGIMEMWINLRYYSISESQKTTLKNFSYFKKSIMTFIGNKEDKTTPADSLFDIIRFSYEPLTKQEVVRFTHKLDPFVHPNYTNFGDAVVNSLSFTKIHSSDKATIYGERNGEQSSLVLEIGDDFDDNIIIRQFSNDLVIFGSGGMTINGTLNVNLISANISTTLETSDDHVTVRYGSSGNPLSTDDAFFIVDRGALNDAEIRWNENDDIWQLNNGDGNYHNFIYDGYYNYVYFDEANKRVGLNIVSPTEALDLDGTIKLTGDILFNRSGDARIKCDYDVRFVHISNVNSQRILTGGLLTSDDYGDESLIPSYGIYSKGDIKINDDNYIGIRTDTDLLQLKSSQLVINGSLQFNNSSAATVQRTTDASNWGGTNTLEGIAVEGSFAAYKIYNSVWNDYAESFKYKKGTKLIPGKVYIQTEDGLEISNKRGDKRVVGVYSDTFGSLLGSKDCILPENKIGKKIPIALKGKVKVWVKEKLEIGDKLISDKNGFATKANIFDMIFRSDRIIGKVLEPSKDKKEKRIEILV